MSPGPPFPKLPPVPPSPIKPLREILKQGRQQVEKARGGIRSIADDMRGLAGIPTETATSGSKIAKEAPVSEKPTSTTSTITRPPTQPELPTPEETTAELKRRLGKELYRAELDLSSKLRIAGKPCDCLDSKHTLGLEAAAEELIAQEPGNPVYSEILQWIKNNRSKVTIEAIVSGKYDNEYPRMAAEFKGFRKRIMGTTVLSAMMQPETPITLEEAKKLASEEAQKEVEKKWHSQEKKPET